MALHSFCGILTLQVGVAMMAVVFWVISSLTFVVNFFEFFGRDKFPIFSLTITSFVLLLLMAGGIAFFAAYNENQSLAMTGVALTSLITVVWIIISSLSFYNKQDYLGYVCVHERCPETFWLAPLKYRLRDQSQHVSQEEYPIQTNGTEVASAFGNLTNSANQASSREVDEPDFNEDSSQKEDNSQDVAFDSDEGTIVGYVFGLPLLGAVILFLCNFLLLLFSILVFWSYGQELAWTDAYLRDIPEYTTA